MVIPNEEPDIVVGGEPSAPPMPIATAVPATAFASAPNKNIERTTNSDGSLMVKVTTTTSLQPNGYREVTMEYFYVPANMADTVIMSMDATGEPPSSLYMTKMEQQVLPPGTSEVTATAVAVAPTVTITSEVGGGRNPTQPPPLTYNPTPLSDYTPIPQSNDTDKKEFSKSEYIAGGIGLLIGTIVLLVTSRGDNAQSHQSSTLPTSNPTKEGCKDTPGWVDGANVGCDFYAKNHHHNWCTVDRFADSDHTYEDRMGPASENCCTCGGGSTYVAPPSSSIVPSSAPTQTVKVKRCKDTPNWVDGAGSGCDYYETRYFSGVDRCKFSDMYEGAMGPASENCCTCGGGSHAMAPTSSPSIAPIIPCPTKAPSLRPTQPPACVDTPDWVDSNGIGCQFYNHKFCEFGADWQGVMGAAGENCCVCGGGTIPFNFSSSKAPTTTVNIPEIDVDKKEMRMNKEDPSSSRKSDFTTSAAKEVDR